MPRAGKRKHTVPKHPDARARERARRHGLIKSYMKTASWEVNCSLLDITGDSPPNTKHTPAELAFAAAANLKIIAAKLNLSSAMLHATDRDALTVQQFMRLNDIRGELIGIAEAAEKHTARALRHEQRMLALEK